MFKRHLLASGPVSKVVTVPPKFLRELGLKEGDPVLWNWPMHSKSIRLVAPRKEDPKRGTAKS